MPKRTITVALSSDDESDNESSSSSATCLDDDRPTATAAAVDDDMSFSSRQVQAAHVQRKIPVRAQQSATKSRTGTAAASSATSSTRRGRSPAQRRGSVRDDDRGSRKAMSAATPSVLQATTKTLTSSARSKSSASSTSLTLSSDRSCSQRYNDRHHQPRHRCNNDIGRHNSSKKCSIRVHVDSFAASYDDECQVLESLPSTAFATECRSPTQRNSTKNTTTAVAAPQNYDSQVQRRHTSSSGARQRSFDDSDDDEVPYEQHLPLGTDAAAGGAASTRPRSRPTPHNVEPLRPGDVLQYTDPVFVAGHVDGRRITQVLAVHEADPNEDDYDDMRLELANGDMLPGHTRVQRIYEFKKNQLWKHPGLLREIRRFRLHVGDLAKDQAVQPRYRDRLRAVLDQAQSEFARLPEIMRLKEQRQQALPTPTPRVDDDESPSLDKENSQSSQNAPLSPPSRHQQSQSQAASQEELDAVIARTRKLLASVRQSHAKDMGGPSDCSATKYGSRDDDILASDDDYNVDETPRSQHHNVRNDDDTELPLRNLPKSTTTSRRRQRAIMDSSQSTTASTLAADKNSKVPAASSQTLVTECRSKCNHTSLCISLVRDKHTLSDSSSSSEGSGSHRGGPRAQLAYVRAKQLQQSSSSLRVTKRKQDKRSRKTELQEHGIATKKPPPIPNRNVKRPAGETPSATPKKKKRKTQERSDGSGGGSGSVDLTGTSFDNDAASTTSSQRSRRSVQVLGWRNNTRRNRDNELSDEDSVKELRRLDLALFRHPERFDEDGLEIGGPSRRKSRSPRTESGLETVEECRVLYASDDDDENARPPHSLSYLPPFIGNARTKPRVAGAARSDKLSSFHVGNDEGGSITSVQSTKSQRPSNNNPPSVSACYNSQPKRSQSPWAHGEYGNSRSGSMRLQVTTYDKYDALMDDSD